MIFTLYRDDGLSREDIARLFDRFPTQRARSRIEERALAASGDACAVWRLLRDFPIRQLLLR